MPSGLEYSFYPASPPLWAVVVHIRAFVPAEFIFLNWHPRMPDWRVWRSPQRRKGCRRAPWDALVLSSLSPRDLSLLVTLTFLSKWSNFLKDVSQNHSGLLSLPLSGDGNYQQKDPKRAREQIQLFWGHIQLPLRCGTVKPASKLQIFLGGEESLNQKYVRRASAPGGQGGQEGTQGLQSTNPLRTPTAPLARKP